MVQYDLFHGNSNFHYVRNYPLSEWFSDRFNGPVFFATPVDVSASLQSDLSEFRIRKLGTSIDSKLELSDIVRCRRHESPPNDPNYPYSEEEAIHKELDGLVIDPIQKILEQVTGQGYSETLTNDSVLSNKIKETVTDYKEIDVGLHLGFFLSDYFKREGETEPSFWGIYMIRSGDNPSLELDAVLYPGGIPGHYHGIPGKGYIKKTPWAKVKIPRKLFFQNTSLSVYGRDKLSSIIERLREAKKLFAQ